MENTIFHDTLKAYQNKSLYDIFVETANKFPNKVAISHHSSSITYAKLHAKAEAMAYFLHKNGLNNTHAVAILFKRSIENIVTILALLKLGIVYAPLDINNPKNRLETIIKNAELDVIITHYLDVPVEGMTVIHYPEIQLDQSDVFHIEKIANTQTACLIFTSGTTGEPKGVEVTHRGIIRLVKNTNYVEFTEQDKVSHLSNLSFDASNFEIWGALLNGAELIILDQDLIMDPTQFSDAILNLNITTMFIPTALFNLIATESPHCLSKLKYLIFGGEAVNVFAVRNSLKTGKPQYLVNGYGPTECTTFATAFFITSVNSEDTSIPIGKPIANTSVYIVNQHMQLADIGEEGEIYLGGDGIANGYYKQEKLTSERFVNDFINKTQQKLYKTGDLAKWNDAGNIEYIGRIDKQVKIRGFRVELSEIEFLLSQLPQVSQAVILSREDNFGSSNLLAYLKLNDDISAENVVNYLNKNFPDYMIPKKIFLVQSFPITPNGKLDTEALYHMQAEELKINTVESLPQTENERQLIELCSSLLEWDPVYINDNLLGLGFDSIKMLRLLFRLQDKFALHLTISDLYTVKNIAELAKLIDESRISHSYPAIKQINFTEGEMSLAPLQGGLWLISQIEKNNPNYNCPFVFQVIGNLNVTHLEECLNQLVLRHQPLRTHFIFQEGVPCQFIHSQYTCKINQYKVPDNEGWITLATKIANTPFDLSQMPLFTVTLFDLKNNRQILLFNFHHIIVDGWSFNNFISELNTLYAQKTLPPLAYQYSDYTQWYLKLLTEDLKTRQINYWRNKLTDAVHTINFPYLHLEDNGGHIRKFELNFDLVALLRAFANNHQVSPVAILLAVYFVMLYRHTQQVDISVGMPVSNRPLHQLELLFGYFVNTLVTRVKLSENLSFLDLAKSINQQLLEDYKHQDVPYESIVSELNPTGSYHALFNCLFVIQNEPEKLVLKGAEVKELILDPGQAKFDLMLSLTITKENIEAIFEYKSKFFNTRMIDGLISDFRSLISEVLMQSNVLLNEFSPAVYTSPVQVNIDRLLDIKTKFEQQVEDTPNKIALAFCNKKITYHELNETVNQVAHYLIESGLHKKIIAVHMDRSIDMITTVLSLCKIGAICLPLDPSYPEEYLSQILKQSNTSCVITNQVMKSPQVSQQVLYYQRIPLDRFPKSNPQISINLDDILYMIFTSGSTGIPKGIYITRKTIANLIDWQYSSAGLNQKYNTLQFTSLNFDVSFEEIYASLCYGSTLILVSEETRKDNIALLDYLEQQKIQRLYLPYVKLQSLAESALTLKRFPSQLKQVISAGEQLYCTDTIKEFFKNLNSACLYNMYGPSETHVVTSYRLEADPSIWEEVVPIGDSIQNTAALIIDENNNLIANPGVLGEIVLTGICVSKCYSDSVENERRFMELDINGNNTLVYKTHDLGEYRLGDKAILYRGRSDGQIKLDGHRVEIGQIEVCLMQHPAIANAAVICHEQTLIAFLVRKEQASEEDRLFQLSMREHLRSQLPYYMQVQKFIFIDNLPLTASGKLDRKALDQITLSWETEEKSGQTVAPSSLSLSSLDTIENTIIGVFRHVLGIKEVPIDKNFFELGANSLLLAKIHTQLYAKLNSNLALLDFFKYPTIAELSQYLQQKLNVSNESLTKQVEASSQIAVIGMSGKFPAAQNIDEFWKNVLDEKECNTFLAPTNVENFVSMRSSMEGIFDFDASYFGISPQEANLMDPQQRHFLMGVVHAIESAGYDPQRFAGKICLVGSQGENHYAKEIFRSGIPVEDFQFGLAYEKDFLATKASYFLNLRGASFTLQSACSSSLVAIHIASQLLLNAECDLSVAGGILIDHSNQQGYTYKEGHIFSKDGHCRPFDANASGTYAANGYCFVVLKKLQQAIEDGDTIYAIIEGSAVNNDGQSKVGYTAPSLTGQVDVIRSAHKHAGVTPDLIGYVEAHGTGTALGDPLEIAALTEAFFGSKQGSCAIASLKSQLGHLGAAAGVAGFIRATLALYHKKLPPNINYTSPNPALTLDKSPFYINAKCHDWPHANHRRFAGVSSFGVGGTNAHVVLSEYISEAIHQTSKSRQNSQLLILSAKTPSALIRQCHDLAEYIQAHQPNLTDIAYTLQNGRTEHVYRTTIACRNNEEAISLLNNKTKETIDVDSHKLSNKQCVFLFPGQGSLFPGMGADLYQNNPQFKFCFDQSAELLQNYLDIDIREIFNPQAHQLIEQSQYSQPVLFAFEYALVKTLQNYGIEPSAMLGHSMGEYVAACVAQVWSLEQALKIICKRGKLIQSVKGGMLAVKIEPKALVPYLSDHVEIAAINAPNLFTLTGDTNSIQECLFKLKKNNIPASLIRTQNPYHSRLLEPILDEFYNFLQGIVFSEPVRPFISNLTGDWITKEQATRAEYWVKHLRECVQYASGLKKILCESYAHYIEVGPGTSLISFMKRQANINRVASVIKNQDSDISFLNCIGQCWKQGLPISWESTKAKRIPLPGYSFDLTTYNLLENAKPNEILKKKSANQWLYTQTWNRLINALPHEISQTYLMFMDVGETAVKLKQRLIATGNTVISVYDNGINANFAQREDGYALDLDNKAHYQALLSAMTIKDYPVLYFSGLNNQSIDAQKARFYSLIYFIQAFESIHHDAPLKITVFTSNIFSVIGNEKIDAPASLVLGPCTVIPQEFDNIKIQCIDLDLHHQDGAAHHLLTHIQSDDYSVDVLALRGNYFWQRNFSLITEENTTENELLRAEGVYLITGGTSGIGLTLAKSLVNYTKVHLILLSRSSKKMEDFQITNGSTVTVAQADVCDELTLKSVIEDIINNYGALNGVIHCAGVPGGGVISLKNKDEAEKVFAPKVTGTLVLDKVTQNCNLDFFVISSSVASVIGSVGQVDYCAANNFIDVFCQSKASERTKYLAIDWDTWQEVGMAVSTKLPGELQRLQDQAIALGLTPQEGVAIFMKVLKMEFCQIIVSTTPLLPRRLNINKRQKSPLHIVNGNLETQLISIFSKHLGYSVAKEDSFFASGGNSLLGIEVVLDINKLGKRKISITDFMRHDSVEKLLALLSSNAPLKEQTLIQLRQGSGNKNLFLIHPIGGDIIAYAALARHLSSDCSIYAIQDLGERESVLAKAYYYTQLIREVQSNGIYYIGGWSFGALIANEIAKQLELNSPHVALILIDPPQPNPKKIIHLDDKALNDAYIREIAMRYKIDVTSESLSDLSNLDNIFNSSPEAMAYLNRILRVFRSNVKAMSDYSASGSRGDCYLYQATQNQNVMLAQQWHFHQSKFIHEYIEGDHYTILQEPNVIYLAKKIDTILLCNNY